MAKAETTEGTLIRVPVHTIILGREGKQVIPQIGKPFAFTEKEIEDIEAANKGALRAPVNESGAVEVAEPTDAARVAALDTNREPARDNRSDEQKKKDAAHAASEAKKPAKGGKKADAADSEI